MNRDYRALAWRYGWVIFGGFSGEIPVSILRHRTVTANVTVPELPGVRLPVRVQTMGPVPPAGGWVVTAQPVMPAGWGPQAALENAA